MPKLFKLLRKRSSPYSPRKKNQGGGIFRSSRKSSKKETDVEAPVIEAAITYTLSEDEDSCGIKTADCTDLDIENQIFPFDEASDKIVFQEKSQEPVKDLLGDIETGEAAVEEEPEASENDEETFTFTSLELMRNELAHMMQLANKDKEIYQLQQDAEEVKAQHEAIVASKDAEIATISKALQEVEAALALAENKLGNEVMQHSKTIGILMETQVQLHELTNQSWFQPLASLFVPN